MFILVYVVNSESRMNFIHSQTGYNDPNAFQMGPDGLNQRYSVPVQNAFGPLGEWVGLSMGINGDSGYIENMDVQRRARDVDVTQVPTIRHSCLCL